MQGSDRAALFAIGCVRKGFDLVTGYPKAMNEEKYLTRMIFLETVAGVPGMVAAMARHLKSLRTMKRDYGWIHTLLEEAENERVRVPSSDAVTEHCSHSSFFPRRCIC
jgi:hypothetical protein